MAEITVYGADWDLVAEPETAAEAEAISGRKNIPVVVLPDGAILVEPTDPELRDALERSASS